MLHQNLRLQPLDRTKYCPQLFHKYLAKTRVHIPQKRTGDADRVVLAAADLLDDVARRELLHEVRREVRVVAFVQVAQLAHAAVAPGEDLTLVCARAMRNTGMRNREKRTLINKSGKSSVMAHSTDKKTPKMNEDRTQIEYR
jgi:hypothetical protein